jgi:hypothetical protein
MVNVRLGTGSFEDFEVLIDGFWPTVPRVGEKVIWGGPENPVVDTVRAVAYQTSPSDELTGVMVLIG